MKAFFVVNNSCKIYCVNDYVVVKICFILPCWDLITKCWPSLLSTQIIMPWKLSPRCRSLWAWNTRQKMVEGLWYTSWSGSVSAVLRYACMSEVIQSSRLVGYGGIYQEAVKSADYFLIPCLHFLFSKPTKSYLSGMGYGLPGRCFS